MNKVVAVMFFAVCLGLSVYVSWHQVVTMPGYQAVRVHHQMMN